MSVLLAKRALPRSLGDAPPPDVAAALASLPDAFGQLGLSSAAANLNIKALKGQPGLYRLRVGDWRAVFVRTADGFLVAAIGLRKDIYERVARMRVARKGEGLRVIEVESPAPEPSEQSARRGVRSGPRARRLVEQNPLTPFSDAELLRIARLDEELIAFLGSLPRTIDVGETVARRVSDADLMVLLVDLWERPALHLDSFRDGGAPTVADVAVDTDELSKRISSEESETELVAAETEGQIRRLLDGTIEEWMVYLHPSQRAIVRAEFNGPARVRGGPGTGKTVVALHRARRLAREGPDGERVLLTTFLRTLPKVWQGLMGTMDPRALEQLDVVNVDALAMRIVRGASGIVSIMEESGRRSLAGSLLKRHALDAVFAGNESLLLEEFDAFITGRGTTDPETYFAIRRRGGGIPLARVEREQVWGAYEEYVHQIARSRRIDYATLRVRALEAVEQGHGERYAGVIVDEAQDITEVGVRLLFGLDASSEHRGFMAVGDGQQSIYPGGFSLRSLGIDVRGRARVLTTNWRNTWNVWTAARAMIEGEAFDDLDEDVGLRPTGDEPGLTPEDRSDPYESFSRPGSWARKERSREARQAHAGADHPQVARGRADARRGQDDPGGGEGARDQRADLSPVA